MSIKEINYCIDAGNTQIKVACFKQDTFFSLQKFTFDELINNPKVIFEINQARSTILSSVLTKEKTNQLLALFSKVILLQHNHFSHLKMRYKTPETLGADRMCNAAYAIKKNKGKGALVVDVGTCIKFDFVNPDNEYIGGSISPGVGLRYKAMNDFTAKLPLLDKTTRTNLIGQSTEQSMHSGVINGIQSEITEMINQYQMKYDGLTTFMTGGDADLFDIPLKNSIFVHENLTLEGLHIILKKHAD